MGMNKKVTNGQNLSQIMKNIIFLLTLMLGSTIMAWAQTGQVPKVGNTYYLYNVGQKKFLSSQDGQLTLGGAPLSVTIQASLADGTSNADDYFSLVTEDGSITASPFSRPQSDGKGKYGDWTLQPTGTDNNYLLACRFKESNTSMYLYYSESFAFPSLEPFKPNTTFYPNALWRFVKPDAMPTQTITLDEASEQYEQPTLGDGVAYATVLLKRKFTVNSWNSFCVPFTITNDQLKAQFGDDVKVAEFTGVNATTLLFTSTDQVNAGTPYLIRPTKDWAEGKTYYEFDGIRSFESSPAQVEQNATPDNGGATVTYQASFQKTTAPAKAYVLRKNQVYHLTDDMAMKGFRGYFTESTSNGAKEITAWMLDGVPTGVTTIDASPNTSQRVYNLQGQRISGNRSLPHGVYITNGKKTIK